MKYPQSAIDRLKDEGERLEQSFMRIWGALSPSHERDAIMHHLFTAKHKLNQLIKENDDNE